jgi:hypothetical protein
MSSISIETKKVSDLTALTTPASAHIIPIQDGNALKKITFANLQSGILAPVREEVAPLLYNNAGGHNAIYRGKNLVQALLRHNGQQSRTVLLKTCTSEITGLSAV